jgi:tripartite-type tricarboxylate transporter receptor subunit TctC
MQQLRSVLPALTASALLVACAFARAEPAYPTRPIRVIVPFAPGGGSDIVARQVGPRMSESMGQPVIIDNRPGAGGNIGAEAGVRATPDGYTIIMTSAAYSANASLYALPYDPVKGVSTISMVGTGPFFVVVHPSVAAKTVQELITYAKANPARVNYGSAGQGSLSHLATELFNMTTGTQLQHVPYKGTGPALTDLVAGHIQVMFGNIVAALPQVKAGRLRGLAVTTAKRSSILPDTPTVAEAGLPGYEANVWAAVLGPPRMPKEIIKRLNDEIRRAISLPAIKDRMTAEGLDVAPSSPEEFAAYLRKDIDKWARVVKAARVKPE